MSCVGCREDRPLPFDFKMAFQPIVDMGTQKVWGYEALVRGPNGEPPPSILDQVSDETRYRFDQATRVMAIQTAGALFDGENLKLSINFLPNAVYEPTAYIQNRSPRRNGWASRTRT
jgi:EAL domain-containing protein (putative c-di-GMP-specific phosphodiesterase class I)